MKYLETIHQRNAARITVLIALLLFLLLFFVGPQYLDPPEEYGVAVNFGTTDVGSGSKPLSQPREAVTEEVVEESQPHEAEVTPTEPAESTPKAEDVLTQEEAEAIAIKKQKEAEAKAKADAEAKAKAEAERIAKENDCTVEFKSADPFVNLNYKNIEIESQLIGDYNYGNIAVAVAIGQHFNVPSENIKNAIESYQPNNNRSEIIHRGSTKIILDAYNANPTSMLAALKNLKQLNADLKYLFLGDMFELGKEAEKEHQAIANFTEDNFDENIFLVGENFYKTTTKSSTKKFKSFEDLKPFIKSLDLSNSTVLIKGSRGMALERILEFL